jgi:hypothetical protein
MNWKIYENDFRHNQHYLPKGLCSVKAGAKGESLRKSPKSLTNKTWDFWILDFRFGIWDLGFFV